MVLRRVAGRTRRRNRGKTRFSCLVLEFADTTSLRFRLDTMTVAESNYIILGSFFSTVNAVKILEVEEG
jgi:hypothetical protein